MSSNNYLFSLLVYAWMEKPEFIDAEWNCAVHRFWLNCFLLYLTGKGNANWKRIYDHLILTTCWIVLNEGINKANGFKIILYLQQDFIKFYIKKSLKSFNSKVAYIDSVKNHLNLTFSWTVNVWLLSWRGKSVLLTTLLKILSTLYSGGRGFRVTAKV